MKIAGLLLKGFIFMTCNTGNENIASNMESLLIWASSWLLQQWACSCFQASFSQWQEALFAISNICKASWKLSPAFQPLRTQIDGFEVNCFGRENPNLLWGDRKQKSNMTHAHKCQTSNEALISILMGSTVLDPKACCQLEHLRVIVQMCPWSFLIS